MKIEDLSGEREREREREISQRIRRETASNAGRKHSQTNAFFNTFSLRRTPT